MDLGFATIKDIQRIGQTYLTASWKATTSKVVFTATSLTEVSLAASESR